MVAVLLLIPIPEKKVSLTSVVVVSRSSLQVNRALIIPKDVPVFFLSLRYTPLPRIPMLDELLIPI